MLFFCCSNSAVDVKGHASVSQGQQVFALGASTTSLRGIDRSHAERSQSDTKQASQHGSEGAEGGRKASRSNSQELQKRIEVAKKAPNINAKVLVLRGGLVDIVGERRAAMDNSADVLEADAPELTKQALEALADGSPRQAGTSVRISPGGSRGAESDSGTATPALTTQGLEEHRGNFPKITNLERNGSNSPSQTIQSSVIALPGESVVREPSGYAPRSPVSLTASVPPLSPPSIPPVQPWAAVVLNLYAQEGGVDPSSVKSAGARSVAPAQRPAAADKPGGGDTPRDYTQVHKRVASFRSGGGRQS